MKIYIISLQEIRSRDQSDKPPTVVKCQDEMLALYYCWMFQHLGTIEQGFYYSSPRHIFLHIETLAGALLLLAVSAPRLNRTRVVPVHLDIFFYVQKHWCFTTVGCIYLQVQQNKGSSSPRHIFYLQKHWRFITVCCFFLQVQQNKGSSSPRHISTYFSTYIETVTIQIWLIGGFLARSIVPRRRNSQHY